MTNNKFKSYDDGIDMSDINAMFKERDAMKIVNNYESSTMTSVTRRRPRRKKKSPNGYIVALAAIVAAGGITLAARTIDITPKGSLHDFGKDVGSIVYVKGDDFNPRYDSTNIGIVSQNTKRNANTYYYDQDGIAKDLVSLDDRLLDITFVSVCEDMGEHLNNKVGQNGETNIDLVISGIKKYAEEGSYAEKDFKDIKCPFCKSSNIERKNRNLESHLYKCGHCNTLFRKYFLSPFTDYSSKYFVEDYKKQYGKTYEDVDNLSRLAKRRIEKIKKIKPNGKVLDIGSAMGFFLKEAANYGYITEGIEISEYASNYCVNTLNLNVHNCSLLDFNYKEKEYDIITAWYVVEHIYNFDKIFENILYSLKDDGIFALAMPNGYGVSGRFNKNYYSIVPSDHAFEANPKSLDMFFAKYSLKRISLENQSIYYNRFTDVFKIFKNSKLSEKLYKKLAQKFNLRDTFECIYQKVK